MHVCSYFSFPAHAKACAFLLWPLLTVTTAHAIHPAPYDFNEKDFAVEVISYEPGDGVGTDSITLQPFTNALTALGRPTVDTTGNGFDIDPDWTIPVVPVWPAYRATELVTIGQGGHLILKFGRRVYDDPRNPFGRDFIIFGNVLQTAAATDQAQTWVHDPEEVILTGNVHAEPGLVAVSQDGTNWITFTDGPFADTFAPTLGRIYDPDDPVEMTGWTNEWWGVPTNPTWPLDPAVASTNLAGRSLVEVAQIYGHSAGGTSFDLGELDLPVDPDAGWKWIQYVRIKPIPGHGTPEIDAVSIVSPASDYQRWHLEQFTWEERMDPAIGGDHGLGNGHGIANVLAFALGRDRIQAGDPRSPLMHMTRVPEEDALRIQFTRRTDGDPVHVVLESSQDLADAGSWSTNSVAGEVSTSNGNDTETVELIVPLSDTADLGAYRLRGIWP